MVALIVILAVIAIIALLLFVPVRIKIYAKYEHNTFVHNYKIKYGFITLKQKRKREKKQTQTHEKDKQANGKFQVIPVIRFIKANAELVKNLISDVVGYTTKKLVSFDSFTLTAILGTDDAMDTALSYGGASAFLYNIVGFAERRTKIRKISIDFKPDFTEPKIFIEFESIIKTKIYNVIGLAFVAIKRGLPLWKKRGEINNGKSD